MLSIILLFVVILGYIQPIFITNRLNYSSDPSTKQPSQSNQHEPTHMKNPFTREKKECILCRLKITANYKNPRLLSQFQSKYTGRIYGRNITGLCRRKHREVEKAMSKSQACGFMPVYHKAPEFLEDHDLYNPDKPKRPHPY